MFPIYWLFHLPARLFAASCALVGSYGGAARVLLQDIGDWEMPASGTVERAALAALEGGADSGERSREPTSVSNEALIEFQALQDLFNRCLVLMLVLVAVVTIFGWN